MLNMIQSTPESQGICSAHILQMIKRLEKHQIPMHSILLSRNDQLVYEGYYAPYDAGSNHRMFSISKSITSLAVGYLYTQGMLHLDDPIADYFPEKCPEPLHPWIQATTIRNMLEMRSCHSATTYKKNPGSDWVESFFTVAPDHPAGTVFHYDTSAAHTLCALVEKLTGKALWDFIREDVFPELDLSGGGYMLKDPFGVSMGGSGLCCTPMDMMKIANVLLHNGNINGRQVIRPDYIKAAVGNLVPTVVKAPLPSEACGYGYQIWQNERNGCVLYGMGGQLAILIPEESLICVTTADTQCISGGNQYIYDAFYEEILDHISPVPIEVNPLDALRLQEQTAALSLTPLKGALDNPLAHTLNGRVYTLMENKPGFSKAALSFTDNVGYLYLQKEEEIWEICFGLGHMQEARFPKYDLRYVASGSWIAENQLYIKCHICDTYVGSVHFQLHFDQKQLVLYTKKVEESLFSEFASNHFIGYL